MKMKRVLLLAAAAVLLTAAAGVEGAWAQAWPNKPIKIIVPFPPGNTVDTQSRLIGPKLTERLGQPVIVENRLGASGMLGMGVVAKAAPDGYTLAAGQGGNLCVLPHTSKNVPYDALKDFAPIALTTTNYLVIYAHAGAPFKTFPEMIAYAKANPGKMTVATNGEGGFPHLAMEHLRLMAGFTYNYIPYKGSAQIGTDVMGGQVMMAFDGVAGAMPAIRSGKVNLLAVTSKKRAAFWPDKPSAAEFVPGYDSGGWFGFVAPAGIPRDIAVKLNAEINRAMNAPEVVEKMVNSGMVVANESVQYFGDLIKHDYAKYGKLVRDIGFKPQ
ncbi:MAG: Bug family tripartite tricarboxylate transporter substrate binding protein [Syntrophales bacterium]